MTWWFWLGYLIGGLILGLIGQAIGQTKGRPVAGFWLGFGLGPIGLIIIAVMDRTAEREAAHVLAVQRQSEYLPRGGSSRPADDFSQWLSGSSRTSTRLTPGAPDRWKDVIAAVQKDSEATTLSSAVQHAKSLTWTVRGPGVWFFADGDFTFVGIVDGRTVVSNQTRATELANTASITYQPTTAGGVHSVRIGNATLTNPRPANQAIQFLTRVCAQPTDPVTPPESDVPQPPAAANQEPALSVRAALTELEALRSEGLVSEEDYATKRVEILSRL